MTNKWAKVIVAIFGAAGFVGRNLVSKLLKEGTEFIAIDIVENPFGKEVDYSKVDIIDPMGVSEAVEKSDIVVHLAASPLLTSLERPIENMRVNIEGTLNVMEACRKFNIDKIIYSSASSVIGEVKYNPVDEEHPCKPKTPYAVAKKACEDYLRVYNEVFNLNYLIFRFFNVYGPWQHPESEALIPTIYRRLTQGETLTIYGDGTATRDYIYAGDIADFYYLAIKRDIKNEIVNMGTGKTTSINDLVRSASEILKVEPKIIYHPPRPGEISNFVADTTKLRSLFGKEPRTSLKEGLMKTFHWLKTVEE